MANIGRLRSFVAEFSRLADAAGGEESVFLDSGRALLQELIRQDDWLPAAFARPEPERYQQYLLHCDPLERFSVVSFVWDKKQSTPIHDHTVWGMVGVLRGAEVGTRYSISDTSKQLTEGAEERLEAGAIDLVSPAVGDLHRVRNAQHDLPSISIHVYGANIGAVRRRIYTPAGEAREFISGYSNEMVPNLWDRSA